MLLSKLWDKIDAGIRRNIFSNTCFLTPRELELSRFLFGDCLGLIAFGGYPDAERKMLCYLPDYLPESCLEEDDGPIACLHATFYQQDHPSHRDFLGALIRSGISRESIGDICVGTGSCDFFVADEIAPFLVEHFSNAGRTRLHINQIPLKDAQIPEPRITEIVDTLSSLRLDSLVSSGFRIGRNAAVQHICTGKTSVDGFPCEKPDKTIHEGATVSVRGLGKIKLKTVNGLTKKGRTSVIIHRYV